MTKILSRSQAIGKAIWIVIWIIILIALFATLARAANQVNQFLPIVFKWEPTIGDAWTPSPTARPTPTMAPTMDPWGQYINEWMHQIVVDVGAELEDPKISHAWDYMDPNVEIMEINPLFEYQVEPGWLIEYVNFYTIEDHAYHWWTGAQEDWSCIGFCFKQGPDWFAVSSNWDIDVFIIKIKRQ